MSNSKLTYIRHDDFDWRMPAKSYIDIHEEFIKAGLIETAVLQFTQDGRLSYYDPELVKYINESPNWDISCHGWAHDNYAEMTVDMIVRDIGAAMYMSHKLFNRFPKTWSTPWNKWSGTMETASKLLGITIDNESYDISKFIRNVESDTYDGHSLYFHGWNGGEMKLFPRMIELAKTVWEINV